MKHANHTLSIQFGGYYGCRCLERERNCFWARLLDRNVLVRPIFPVDFDVRYALMDYRSYRGYNSWSIPTSLRITVGENNSQFDNVEYLSAASRESPSPTRNVPDRPWRWATSENGCILQKYWRNATGCGYRRFSTLVLRPDRCSLENLDFVCEPARVPVERCTSTTAVGGTYIHIFVT